MTIKPIHPISDYPNELNGYSNGKLPSTILVTQAGSSPPLTMCKTAMRSFLAMDAYLRRDLPGLRLRVTSWADSYRPYEIQYEIFHQRYTTERLDPTPDKVCGNVNYWLIPPNDTAACPGTSNHGLGLALDFVLDSQGKILNWLIANAWTFGFSAELQSEDWHWRYCTGDNIPAATLRFEANGMATLDSEDLANIKKTVWYTDLDTGARNISAGSALLNTLDGGAKSSEIAAVNSRLDAQQAQLNQILTILQAGGGSPALIPHQHTTDSGTPV